MYIYRRCVAVWMEYSWNDSFHTWCIEMTVLSIFILYRALIVRIYSSSLLSFGFVFLFKYFYHFMLLLFCCCCSFLFSPIGPSYKQSHIPYQKSSCLSLCVFVCLWWEELGAQRQSRFNGRGTTVQWLL